MEIDQNQIDKPFLPRLINSLDFSFITKVDDSFNFRMFFLIFDDIFQLNLTGTA